MDAFTFIVGFVLGGLFGALVVYLWWIKEYKQLLKRCDILWSDINSLKLKVEAYEELAKARTTTWPEKTPAITTPDNVVDYLRDKYMADA